MVGGLPIVEVNPAEFFLVLTWKTGHEILWPAATRHDAIQCRHKISLRTDLMQRLEVRTHDQTEGGEPLWDADWDAATRNDVLEFHGVV